jgi:hypothetical protein
MHASYVSIARESNREIEVAGPPAGAPNRRDRLLAIFRPQSQARAESIGSFTPIGQASLPRRARTRALPVRAGNTNQSRTRLKLVRMTDDR